MRLIIEIAAAVLLVCCISATSAAFSSVETDRRADGLDGRFSVPANASQAQRYSAIRRQCDGKFWANAPGDGLLSAG